jgi:hypothetical protein
LSENEIPDGDGMSTGRVMVKVRVDCCPTVIAAGVNFFVTEAGGLVRIGPPGFATSFDATVEGTVGFPGAEVGGPLDVGTPPDVGGPLDVGGSGSLG